MSVYINNVYKTISILKVNGPTTIGAVKRLNMLAFTAQPMATAIKVGISNHLLNKVVNPNARNIKIISNAKLIGKLVYSLY